MYTLYAIWSRPADTDLDAFEAHYTGIHAPLASEVPNMRRFLTTLTTDGLAGGAPAFYRVAEMSFDSKEALETAEEPITANAICPGYVLTPLVEAQIPDTMEKYNMGREEVIKKVMLERQPSREFATVEQLGGTAVFLCSDAAAQITGTTISVDGGWTAL